jgi:hypothetical protein
MARKTAGDVMPEGYYQYAEEIADVWLRKLDLLDDAKLIINKRNVPGPALTLRERTLKKFGSN